MSPETLDLPTIAQELAAIEQELNRRRWARDPVAWANEKLGDTFWSKQIEILRAVRDHRKVAAATSHQVGKSFQAGVLAAWWIDTHKPGEAFVVTTAPSNDQVRIILWKEIGRARERGNLAGRVNQTEWKLVVGEKEETVGIGRKPDDYNPSAFQGVHAPYVLVIIDEANGVRGPLWHAIDSLTANDTSKMLEIGNPDDPSGEFFEHCKPGSGYKVIHISAFDSPNFTGEEMPALVKQQLIGPRYVEEKRAKWAPSWTWIDSAGDIVRPLIPAIEPPPDGVKVIPPPDGKLEDTHPFWQSKVLGQFPVQHSIGSLIPLSWIRAAQGRTLTPTMPNELALDVGASEHGDPSCCGHRQGSVFRVLYEERQPDTMKTTGKLLQHLRDASYGASLAKVDYIGVGRGVVDRAKEQGLPVYPIQVGEKSTILSCIICKHEWDQNKFQTKHQTTVLTRCPKCNSDLTQPVYANLLSQLWWSVRVLFESGEMDIDPADEDLAEQLLSLRWEPNSKGQTVVKYTEGPSPNRADALMLAFAPVPVAPKKSFATW